MAIKTICQVVFMVPKLSTWRTYGAFNTLVQHTCRMSSCLMLVQMLWPGFSIGTTQWKCIGNDLLKFNIMFFLRIRCFRIKQSFEPFVLCSYVKHFHIFSQFDIEPNRSLALQRIFWPNKYCLTLILSNNLSWNINFCIWIRFKIVFFNLIFVNWRELIKNLKLPLICLYGLINETKFFMKIWPKNYFLGAKC